MGVLNINISYSRATSFRGCPQEHHFNYVECLRTRKVVRPLSFGSDMHTLLQYRCSKKKTVLAKQGIIDAFNELTPSSQEGLNDKGDYLDDVFTIFGDYERVWKGTELPIQTEHEFKVPLGIIKGEPLIFHGIIDELYEGNILGEHKTFTTAPNMSILAMNTQVCLYAKAHELETGEVIKRVRWDYIHSRPASYPIWLDKSGRFSLAANSKITPFSWARACKAHDITDEATLALGENYRPNITNSFFRCEFDLVPQMVTTVWEDFKRTARDIFNRGTNLKTKHIDRDCDWCDFRPLCFAEFTGADVQYIKDHDYVVKERN